MTANPQNDSQTPISASTHPLLFRLASELGKPLAFFDLETTTNSPAKSNFGIIEFAYLAVMPDGGVMSFASKINPENRVDEIAAQITGIDPAELLNHRPFPAHQKRIRSMMEKTVLLGFNITTFDIPGLVGQFERYGLASPESWESIDIRDVWKAQMKTQKGRLGEVAEHYGKPFDGAHRALADTVACAEILEQMLWRHGSDFVRGSMRLRGELINPPKEKQSSTRAFSAKDAELTPAQSELKAIIDSIAPMTVSVSDFSSKIGACGFSIEVTKGGAAYIKDGVRFGGSALGAGYSWKDVVARLTGDIPQELIKGPIYGPGAARAAAQTGSAEPASDAQTNSDEHDGAALDQTPSAPPKNTP